MCLLIKGSLYIHIGAKLKIEIRSKKNEEGMQENIEVSALYKQKK
jgi:hypothetical protein